MKIAINTCYGGFSLSPKAEYEVLKRMGYANIKYLNEDKVEVPSSGFVISTQMENM